MSKALDELAREFEQWRSSPTRSRATPPELLVGVAHVLKSHNRSIVAKRLGINSDLIKKAKSLVASSDATAHANEHVNISEPSFIKLVPSSSNTEQYQQASSPLIAARIEIGSSTIHLELSLEQLMQLMAHGHGGAH